MTVLKNENTNTSKTTKETKKKKVQGQKSRTCTWILRARLPSARLTSSVQEPALAPLPRVAALPGHHQRWKKSIMCLHLPNIVPQKLMKHHNIQKQTWKRWKNKQTRKKKEEKRHDTHVDSSCSTSSFKTDFLLREAHLSVQGPAPVPIPRVVAPPVHHQNVRVGLRVQHVPVVCHVRCQVRIRGEGLNACVASPYWSVSTVDSWLCDDGRCNYTFWTTRYNSNSFRAVFESDWKHLPCLHTSINYGSPFLRR